MRVAAVGIGGAGGRIVERLWQDNERRETTYLARPAPSIRTPKRSTNSTHFRTTGGMPSGSPKQTGPERTGTGRTVLPPSKTNGSKCAGR